MNSVAKSPDIPQGPIAGAVTAQPLPSTGTAPVTPPAASVRNAAPGLALRLWRARWFIALRTFAIFIALWAATAAWVSSPIQMPGPDSVFSALVGLAKSGELFNHALISTSRLAISMVVATALAVPLGFFMALNRTANGFIDPVIELLRPISGIAWIPLGLFIFGVGGTLPVFIMVYVAFFPLLLNTVDGVLGVDPKLMAAARTMGVGRRARLLQIAVPAATPSIMVGFRISFASAWAAIIAAELIGSPNGLGFAIEWYRQLLMSPKVFAFIVVIGLVGYLCDVGLRKLVRKLTPWADEAGIGS